MARLKAVIIFFKLHLNSPFQNGKSRAFGYPDFFLVVIVRMRHILLVWNYNASYSAPSDPALLWFLKSVFAFLEPQYAVE
ncbi:hypothetical protein PCORN_03388 [Listeria cornellensis FSL F6-0969]|uniref:Uncharacterized protein n=1 Tax=Listeria cornellensis FSL F6-0969 TaxID=1265820 RepID=W7C457_9LIST|nr:hypothetical protein PCORN_03388 [Listeria cornellensis FSL F6-0969]